MTNTTSVPVLQQTTVRKFYETFNRVTKATAEDVARQVVLFEIELNGTPLGDHPLEVRDGKRYSTVHTKEFDEGWTVAKLLVAAGLHPVSITSQKEPAPDTLVRFADGTQCFVEETAISDRRSSQKAGYEETIKAELRRAADEDVAFREAVGTQFVRIKFAKPVPKRDIAPCIREFAKYIKQHPIAPLSRAGYKTIGNGYPLLQNYVAQFDHQPTTMIILTVDSGIVAPADPAKVVEDFKSRLEDKQQAKYDGSPVWLVVAIDDPEQQESIVLDALRPVLKNTTTGQFEKIIVGYEREVVVLPGAGDA